MNQVAVQRLQLGFLSLQERQVGFADPISQQRLRPAVRDDMMGFHQNSAVGFPWFKNSEVIKGMTVERHNLPGHRIFPMGDSLLVCKGKDVYKRQAPEQWTRP